MFGTFEFKLELKIFYNTKCQHPYDPKKSFCKKCESVENEIYTQKLHEARFYHKFALLNSQSKFFIVKNSIEMFKLNLIMYHWQFRIYFDKKKYLPNVDEILKNHNYEYKDFYPELYIQFEKNCVTI